MGWLVRERRGASWKDQTLDSLSAPPLPLLVFFGLFIMLMSLATYSEFKERVERSKMGFRLGLLLLPLVGVLVVNIMIIHRRWWRYAFGVRRSVYEAVANDGSSVVGLVVVLALLLVMVYYQSSFQSAWFRPI
ncbi:uncharacterized protein LOC105166067 [Sesamum indicum]|uniref:Uncharacterized protein LOC105166067 n=1 Tax=Sesamum indicum TaxID=4182 RepID=A0A6I9TQX7_SESIN|nr:uncharacterized protein LOC105166067 [Sesamum indicum]